MKLVLALASCIVVGCLACDLHDRDVQVVFVVDHTGVSAREYEQLTSSLGPWFLENFSTGVPCRRLRSGTLCCKQAVFRGSAITVIPTHEYAPMLALTFKVGNNYFRNLTERLSPSNNAELRPEDSSNALAPVYALEMKRIEDNARWNNYRKNVRTVVVTVSTSQGTHDGEKAVKHMRKLLGNKRFSSIVVDYNRSGQFEQARSDYLKQLASAYRSGQKAYLQVRDFAYQSVKPSHNPGPMISQQGLSDLLSMIQCLTCSATLSCPYSM